MDYDYLLSLSSVTYTFLNFIFSWHYLQVAHDTVDYDIRITQINQMQDLNRQKKFHFGKL